MSGIWKNRWPLLPAASAAVIVGFWLLQGQAADTPDKPAEISVPVTTAIATRRDLPVTVQGVGSIQAYNTVSVHPQVDGQLLQVAFHEGQQVHVGDLLGQIDPRSYQAALDQAVAKKAEDQALLANARTDAQRNAALVEKQFVAPQVYDALRAKADQLQAAVDGDNAAIAAARLQLDYTAIRSPIEGRAGIRQIDAGNILHGLNSGSPPSTGSDTLVVISQLHPISVVFTLPQEELPRLLTAQAGGSPEVTVFGRDGGPPLDRGRLQVIDNQVNPSTGMVRLKATLPNDHGLLWPGQFVNARLLVETRAQTVTVPATAVQRSAQGDTLFVVQDDSTVAPRQIVVGAMDGAAAEIIDGVSAGETVVTAGHYRLHPGVKVAANLATAAASRSTP